MRIYHSWNYPMYDAVWKARSYTKGLGVISEYDGRSAAGHGKYIIYYKKGHVECGRKDTIGFSAIEAPRPKVECYPNPVIDYLNISIDGNKHLSIVVKIQDITGRIVLESHKNGDRIRVDMSELGLGVYWVRVQYGSANYLFKTLKN